MDIRIRGVLAELGVESRTAESLGCKELSNGDLVSAAVANRFTCLLTRDRLFSQSASRTLRRFPEFAIVVVRLRQQKWPAYGEAFRQAWMRQRIEPSAGQAVLWPRRL